MTASALGSIAKYGGPRCCKRDSFLAIGAAVAYARTYLHVDMEETPVICRHYEKNNQCLGSKCPFFPG